MRSWNRSEDVWGLIELFLDDLVTLATPLAITDGVNPPPYSNGGPVVRLSFEELEEKYGLEFRCKPSDSVRPHLYERRVEIAEDYGLWWAPNHAVGLMFTRDPALGQYWWESMSKQRELRDARKDKAMWKVACLRSPGRIGPYARRAIGRADRRHAQLQREKSKLREDFRQLMPGYEPEDPAEEQGFNMAA
jgi:hypothetical protein